MGSAGKARKGKGGGKEKKKVDGSGKGKAKASPDEMADVTDKAVTAQLDDLLSRKPGAPRLRR